MTGELDQDTAWLERIGAKTPDTDAADDAEESAEEDDADADDGEADGGDDDQDDQDDQEDGEDQERDDDQDDDEDDYGDDPDPAGYDLDDYNHRYTDNDDEDDESDDVDGDDDQAAILESFDPLRFTAEVTDLDLDPEDEEPVNRRFTPWVLGAGVAAVVVAAVATTVLANINTPEPTPSPTALAPITTSRPAPPHAPPPPPPSVEETGDGPIPFSAHSDCNPAGSTPAQSVAVPDSPTPFICVIDGPGQVVDIQLGPPGMPQSYVITGITIVPGAVGKPGRPPTEPDPWLQHHVVTRIQWGFNDTANTPLSMNTGNVRGEVPMPVPRLVASHITAIIQETSRPPAPQPVAVENQDNGSVFGGILGPAPANTSTAPIPGADTPGQPDISDRTFAITSIKIIGHKANQ